MDPYMNDAQIEAKTTTGDQWKDVIPTLYATPPCELEREFSIRGHKFKTTKTCWRTATVTHTSTETLAVTCSVRNTNADTKLRAAST